MAGAGLRSRGEKGSALCMKHPLISRRKGKEERLEETGDATGSRRKHEPSVGPGQSPCVAPLHPSCSDSCHQRSHKHTPSSGGGKVISTSATLQLYPCLDIAECTVLAERWFCPQPQHLTPPTAPFVSAHSVFVWMLRFHRASPKGGPLGSAEHAGMSPRKCTIISSK